MTSKRSLRVLVSLFGLALLRGTEGFWGDQQNCKLLIILPSTPSLTPVHNSQSLDRDPRHYVKRSRPYPTGAIIFPPQTFENEEFLMAFAALSVNSFFVRSRRPELLCKLLSTVGTVARSERSALTVRMPWIRAASPDAPESRSFPAPEPSGPEAI